MTRRALLVTCALPWLNEALPVVTGATAASVQPLINTVGNSLFVSVLSSEARCGHGCQTRGRERVRTCVCVCVCVCMCVGVCVCVCVWLCVYAFGDVRGCARRFFACILVYAVLVQQSYTSIDAAGGSLDEHTHAHAPAPAHTPPPTPKRTYPLPP